MYVRACSFEKHLQEKKLDHYDHFGSCTPPPGVSSTSACKTIVVRVARLQACPTSPPRVPTSSELNSQGKTKGTNFVPPHDDDAFHATLHMSCNEFPVDLIAPPIVEDRSVSLTLSSNKSTEIHSASALSHDDYPTTSTMSCVQIANVLVTPPTLQDCAINFNVSCDQTTEINASLSFTYVCKLSRDTCLLLTNDLLSYYNTCLCQILNVQPRRSVKVSDIHIYHAYNLSLLLACLQNKHRRGRLSFQGREDDEDMNTSDLKPFFGTKDETTSRTTSIQEGEDDEDITIIDTTMSPRDTHPLVPQLQGHLARARARQINYQVPLFVGTLPNNHENMMLPKSNVFMIFRNDETSMDEKVKHWNMIVHGDGSGFARIRDDDASEDFRSLKPP
jgi:hypothetical protein